MSILALANRISTDRPGDVLEGLIAKVSELNRDLVAYLIVGGRRDADATRLSDPLKPSRDIDAIAENVVALDQNVTEIDPDPVQHTLVLGDVFVAFRHCRLPRDRTFDRIDHRGKLKQHAIPCGLNETTPVFRHKSISNRAVFAEGAGGADLIEAHEAQRLRLPPTSVRHDLVAPA